MFFFLFFVIIYIDELRVYSDNLNMKGEDLMKRNYEAHEIYEAIVEENLQVTLGKSPYREDENFLIALDEPEELVAAARKHLKDDTITFNDILEVWEVDSWGHQGDYTKCGYCQNIIYAYGSEDKDFFMAEKIDIACPECVKEVEEVTDAYINNLINDLEKTNFILDGEEFESRGFKVIDIEYNELEKRLSKDYEQFILDIYLGDNKAWIK